MATFANRRAADVGTAFSHVGFMLIGGSGAGKSRAGALFPDPLVISVERQAMNTILEWNPQAVVVLACEDDSEGTYTGHPGQPIDDPKIRMRIVDDTISAVKAGRAVEGGGRTLPGYKLNRHGDIERFVHSDNDPVIRTVVLDSATEWQRVKMEGRLGRKVGEVNESKLGWDGVNWLQDSTIGLLRKIRDLPLHSCVLALSEEKDVQGSSKEIPAFFGKKVGPAVAQFFNAVGWLVKLPGEEGAVRFAAVFEGATERALTKGCQGLQAIEQLPERPEEGGPAKWIESIIAKQAARALGLPEEPEAEAVDTTRSGSARDVALGELNRGRKGSAGDVTLGEVKATAPKAAPSKHVSGDAPPATGGGGGRRGRAERKS